eukprot:CAMPEP_0116557542 /NCGR_PEP_ID=MMETSP0397-20121206/9299_1 /TAXON_ID=216820 /ORGANISM="Cyclophora tenuis, Strain ECT3854" /LENGTH=370 /DNA_ID=CAMNT_0004083013 /DNA_START=117 /DNA_END=1229 /DNA_ORIENTATION=-
MPFTDDGKEKILPKESGENQFATATTTHPQPTTAGTSEQPTSDREGACAETKMTCDALCSLSYTTPHLNSSSSDFSTFSEKQPRRGGSKGCPKQHQLPMFLSKTYHMIDRCDPSIATWSPTGDNFVVKNVEKFASNILPMYFKHSNFSSFARQLNFYGFRKLKAEPILTADFDARTACYVRFYHEHFQKDRPELLANIKRATKSDQQSKDDVESLKMDIAKLKEVISQMSSDYDRRMTEMSYEYNRRITALSAEYDKLAVLVQQLLTSRGVASEASIAAVGPPSAKGVPDMMHSLSQVAAMSLQNSLRPPPLAAAGMAAVAATATAVSAATPAPAPAAPAPLPATAARKRGPNSDMEEEKPPASNRPRLS